MVGWFVGWLVPTVSTFARLFLCSTEKLCPHHMYTSIRRMDLKQGHQIKWLLSVNVCSEEGNSAGTRVSKMPPGIFAHKGKMNAYYFRSGKTAILGAIKAQLPFSEGNYQLLNSRNKLPFPTVLYHLHLNLQLLHPSSHKYLLKSHKTI